MKPRICLAATLACLLSLTGCVSWVSNNSQRSTSAVDFLYPSKKPFVEPSVPTLSLPMRVGVVFVPPGAPPGNTGGIGGVIHNPQLSETAKNELMRGVSDQFKKLPYVQSIEAIPTHYLCPGGSFENLDQLRSLLGVDVIVLLAYDQQQVTTDTWMTLSYWTIVGAYTVPAQKNSTATLMEAVVYDIASRKLLFRAAGTSVVNHKSTFAGMGDQLLNDSAKSYSDAATDLGKNLQTELATFKVRIKESPEDINVVAKPGYNLAAGALGAGEVAVMAAFAMAVLILGYSRVRLRTSGASANIVGLGDTHDTQYQLY
ncbi:MAG: rhombotarget lipoprotein [Opitutaceae bacterium]|jgi:rhombotail lipoprotein|nr:rhombotarget lipoprotein [Opitutaceae bacterium]